MTRIVLLLLFLSGPLLRSQSTFKANDLVGDWLITEKKNLVIRFFASGKEFYGMTAWMGKPRDEHGKLRTDVHNPDPAKRSRTLLNAVICEHFVYKGDGVWADGTIYDTRTGKTYSCKITMTDINTVRVRGYVGFSMLGTTLTFTRKGK